MQWAEHIIGEIHVSVIRMADILQELLVVCCLVGNRVIKTFSKSGKGIYMYIHNKYIGAL